jgi:hypothetical protein
VAEFTVPEIVNTRVVADMKRASYVQPYAGVLTRVMRQDPDTGIDALNGLFVLPNGQLFINAYEYVRFLCFIF